MNQPSASAEADIYREADSLAALRTRPPRDISVELPDSVVRFSRTVGNTTLTAAVVSDGIKSKHAEDIAEIMLDKAEEVIRDNADNFGVAV